MTFYISFPLFLKNLIRFTFLLAFSSQLACDVRQELKELHDSTKKMEKNTEKMIEITDRMENTTRGMNKNVEKMNKQIVEVKDSTQQMNEKFDVLPQKLDETNNQVQTVAKVASDLDKKIGDLRSDIGGLDNKIGGLNVQFSEVADQARQGVSTLIRDNSLSRVKTEISLESKVRYAAEYFMAYDFQLWKGIGVDKLPNRRNTLINEAFKQFYKDIYEIYRYNDEVYPLADPLVGNEFNMEASFNAVALALHLENYKQAENLDYAVELGRDESRTHMLKLIKESLLVKKQLENGSVKIEDIPEYQKEVLENEKVSIKLLQARWNFLVACAIDRNFLFKKTGYFRYVRALWKVVWTWDLDFLESNDAILEKQLLFLRKSLETREFLASLGEKTDLEFLLKTIVKRMRPKNIDRLKPASQAKVKEILNLLDKLTK